MINFAENLNKMITAGLGGETDAPRTEVAIGYRSVYLDASGPVADFETNVVAPLKRLLVTMEPVQEGIGDPSPENIRPITGYDSVTVIHNGENLLDLSSGTKGIIQPEGTRTFLIGTSGLHPTPDGSFTLSAGQYTFASYGFRFKTFRIYGSGGSIIFSSSDRDKYTFTIAESGSFALYFSISPEDFTSWDDARVSLVCGASAGEYVPYQAETITISLGQTVYSGTLDVSTGTLTIDMAFAELQTANSSDWRRSTVYSGAFYVSRDVLAPDGSAFRADTPFICSHAKSVDTTEDFVYGTCYCGGYLNFRLFQSGASISDWISYLQEQKNNGTPVEVCAELETPLTVQLTPEQVITMLGKNTISSDAGDVSLSYLYYEETEGY